MAVCTATKNAINFEPERKIFLPAPSAISLPSHGFSFSHATIFKKSVRHVGESRAAAAAAAACGNRRVHDVGTCGYVSNAQAAYAHARTHDMQVHVHYYIRVDAAHIIAILL